MNQFTDLALSPDNRKIALVAHGDVFAASARDGGEALQVTAHARTGIAGGVGAGFSRIGYVSQRDAITHVFLYDFAHRTRRS